MEQEPPFRHRDSTPLMKRMSARITGVLALLFCAHCTQTPDTTQAPDTISWHSGECHSLAQSRLGLYVHSDIYPLSEKERNDALLSLYSECMKQYGVKIAKPALDQKENTLLPPHAASPMVVYDEHRDAPQPDHRKAIAAPVSPVAITSTPQQPLVQSTPKQTAPVADPLPPPPTQPTVPPDSPFSVAVPPSPELAAKLHPPLKSKVQPAPSLPPASVDDNGRSQLENIINKP